MQKAFLVWGRERLIQALGTADLAALRLLEEPPLGGVLPVNDTVYEDLLKKHPSAKPDDSSVMIEGDIPFVHPSIFASIDEATIAKAG